MFLTKAKDVLIKLNNLNDKDYTVESWAAFVTELTALNKKLDTTVSAREVLDIIVKADYIESQLKPNKDLLQDLINKANGLNRASYTAASLKVVDVEVEKATAVLNNPEATKEEVEAVVAALTKAMSGLEIKPNNPSVDTNTPVKPGDTTASVKTGDDSNLVSALGAVTSLSVIAYLSRKKKK